MQQTLLLPSQFLSTYEKEVYTTFLKQTLVSQFFGMATTSSKYNWNRNIQEKYAVCTVIA